MILSTNRTDCSYVFHPIPSRNYSFLVNLEGVGHVAVILSHQPGDYFLYIYMVSENLMKNQSLRNPAFVESLEKISLLKASVTAIRPLIRNPARTDKRFSSVYLYSLEFRDKTKQSFNSNMGLSFYLLDSLFAGISKSMLNPSLRPQLTEFSSSEAVAQTLVGNQHLMTLWSKSRRLAMVHVNRQKTMARGYGFQPAQPNPVQSFFAPLAKLFSDNQQLPRRVGPNELTDVLFAR